MRKSNFSCSVMVDNGLFDVTNTSITDLDLVSVKHFFLDCYSGKHLSMSAQNILLFDFTFFAEGQVYSRTCRLMLVLEMLK